MFGGIWTRASFQDTRLQCPSPGEALPVRRVPNGKLKQNLTVVYFSLGIFALSVHFVKDLPTDLI